jgi:hypothetical protein
MSETLLKTAALMDAANVSDPAVKAINLTPSAFTETGRRLYSRRDAILIGIAGALTGLRAPVSLGLRMAREFLDGDEALRATGNPDRPFRFVLRTPGELFAGGRTLLATFSRNGRHNVLEVPGGVAFDPTEFRQANDDASRGPALLTIEVDPIVQRIDEVFRAKASH